MHIYVHMCMYASIYTCAILPQTPTHTPSYTNKHIHKILPVAQHFHRVYHLKSSGLIEQMNGTLKCQLTKLTVSGRLMWECSAFASCLLCPNLKFPLSEHSSSPETAFLENLGNNELPKTRPIKDESKTWVIRASNAQLSCAGNLEGFLWQTGYSLGSK